MRFRLVMQILKDPSVAPEPVTLPHILTIRSITALAASHADRSGRCGRSLLRR
jgi:hypothetical protein